MPYLDLYDDDDEFYEAYENEDYSRPQFGCLHIIITILIILSLVVPLMLPLLTPERPSGPPPTPSFWERIFLAHHQTDDDEHRFIE